MDIYIFTHIHMYVCIYIGVCVFGIVCMYDQYIYFCWLFLLGKPRSNDIPVRIGTTSTQELCIPIVNTGGGHGNPLQCSFLENPHMQERSLEGCSPWDCTESGTTEAAKQQERCKYSFPIKGTKTS